ncbi:TetR/AcrR family transcriptional regulator [Kitasatospora sp. CM 4170]|uniref:TetR/AcrR family transcriptional regulator n=1 Tax=Kitasatospora aburaviensis TaxID=67265 RepID=A0ABW1ENM2_9ACTN|nr:TetR/AcrR family transcriptional regulator [Kitasatospora sp. CM 4170]WNM48621.1 TetR/AcrR family transcriptional regulator [Kitasatospora sp. CM 4170]
MSSDSLPPGPGRSGPAPSVPAPSDSVEAGRVRPTIGRGEKVRTAVLAATLAELAEMRYAALTVDAVARRAGVHKTTVYRRWKDKDGLIVDALAGQIAAEIPIPDTGTVDGDLRLLARGLAAWLRGPSGAAVLAVMLSEAAQAPGLAAARAQIFDDRLQRAEPIITRAVERGELPAGIDPAAVIKAVAAPLYFRVLITAEPVDDEAADRSVTAALAAARNGGLG